MGNIDNPLSTNKGTIAAPVQTQRMFVGKFTLLQNGGNVCLDNGEGEWMECRAADIEEVLQDFWDTKVGDANYRTGDTI